jgi:hypothetical protein
MPTIRNLSEVVGPLEDMPEVKDLFATFQAAANLHAKALSELDANEDYTPAGKAKLREKAEEAFTKRVADVQGRLDNLLDLAHAKAEKAIAEANRPPSLPPTAPIDAVFAIESARNMTAADLVDAYAGALASGDYLTRRACESVAGRVLAGDEVLEHRTRFDMLKHEATRPTPAMLEAQGRLDVLRKAGQVLAYSVEELRSSGKLPFIGESITATS